MLIRRSLTASIPHVYSEDSALDKSDPSAFKEAWDKFLKQCDPKLLPVRDGSRLTVFTLRRLSKKQQEYVANLDGVRMCSAAVALGLAGVTDFEVDGRPIVLDFEPSDLGPRVKERQLEEMYDLGLFSQLAVRIMDVSRLDFTLG